MQKLKNSRALTHLEPDKKDSMLLSAIPKRNPFSVPEGYFDRLPVDILAQIGEHPNITYSLKQRIQTMLLTYKIAVAAILVGIAFCISYVVFISKNSDSVPDGIQQITASELIKYDGYLVDLDESLVDAWIDEGGDQVNEELVDLEGLKELSEADVIAYLRQVYSEDELRLDP